jgi:hypothetical protein
MAQGKKEVENHKKKRRSLKFTAIFQIYSSKTRYKNLNEKI